MSGRHNESRAYSLLHSIMNGMETKWMPMNATEQAAVDHANLIREFMKSSKSKKRIYDSIKRANWSMGTEMLAFLSTYHKNAEIAETILILSCDYNTDAKTGLLQDVYNECISTGNPPEWVMPGLISLVNTEKRQGLIINPNGVRI